MKFTITLIILVVGMSFILSTTQLAQRKSVPTAGLSHPSEVNSTQQSIPNTESVTSHEQVVMREGSTEIPASELTSFTKVIINDARHDALQRLANKRQFVLEIKRVKGLIFPESHRTIFIPAFNKQGRESGFLASNGESWVLSLSTKQMENEIIETYSAKFGQDKLVVVEVVPRPKMLDTDSAYDTDNARYVPTVSSLSYSSSCQYVSRYSISYGCWSLPDNPFGYYYVQVYRWGWTSDPRSPSWWACYRGAIHICPQYQSGSYSIPKCGFPPPHPQG